MVSEYLELRRDDISSTIDNDTQDRQIERDIKFCLVEVRS